MRVSRNWARAATLLLVVAMICITVRTVSILRKKTGGTSLGATSAKEAHQTERPATPTAATRHIAHRPISAIASNKIDDECAALLNRVARALGRRAQDARRAMSILPKMCDSSSKKNRHCHDMSNSHASYAIAADSCIRFRAKETKRPTTAAVPRNRMRKSCLRPSNE